MSTTTIVVIIVAVIVVAALLAGLMAAQRRRRLQRRFGPEYDRLVDQRDSRLKAEAELTQRERRVRRLDIRPLTEEARARYAVQWAGLQEEFVDSPADAVSASHMLVAAVMNERGYPTDDRDQVFADLSVDHSSTLEHYRAAEQISERTAAGSASTENLRQAVIHYRALFLELLGEDSDIPDPAAVSGPVSYAVAEDGQPVEIQDDLVSPEEPVGAADEREPVATAAEAPGEAEPDEAAGAEAAADADIPMQRTPRS